jgi:hypothetical protein
MHVGEISDVLHSLVRGRFSVDRIQRDQQHGAGRNMARDEEAAIKEGRNTMKRRGEDLQAIWDYVKAVGDQVTAIAKVNDLLAIAPKLSTCSRPAPAWPSSPAGPAPNRTFGGKG